mgnify:CR=1 FL=1
MKISNDSLQKNLSHYKLHKGNGKKFHLTERIDNAKKFSELLENNIEQLAATLTSEVGKPLQQSRNEINGARARIKWLTENAEKYLSDEINEQPEWARRKNFL